MVNLSEVEKARCDVSVATSIYHKVFFDSNNNPKARMWLSKKGVPKRDLDEVEAQMRMTFVNCMNSYTYQKIPFEKYVWTEFTYTLINWFKSQKAKKVEMINIGLIDENGDEIDVNIGDLSDDVALDFEVVIGMLPKNAQTIARTLFYSDGWKKSDIKSYYGFNECEFLSNMKIIKKVVRDYLDFKL